MAGHRHSRGSSLRMIPTTMGLALAMLSIVNVSPGLAQEIRQERPWTGKFADGTMVTQDNVAEILRQHVEWLKSEGKEGRQADLSGANLTGANLIKANLTKANQGDVNLTEAELQAADLTEVNMSWGSLNKATLSGAKLQRADLSEANLRWANLAWANLTKAYLMGARLVKASLRRANLTEANLTGVDLTEADLTEADLTGADLRGADLTGVWFEPKLGCVPYIPSMQAANNLSSLTFRDSPHGLIELREALTKAGLREQEREVTYAIEHTKRVKWTHADPFSKFFRRSNTEEENSTEESTFFQKLGLVILGWIGYAFIELPCQYGMSPWRPLVLLGLGIPFFFVPYVVFLWTGKTDGIWKVWSLERMRQDLGAEGRSKLLKLRGWPAIRVGFYFSIVSAFSIGWRDLNVGNWLARLKREEYEYRATGWARSVSGFQSLLSVYLLALWALTYFGRPFE